jgi:hypothetical protein
MSERNKGLLMQIAGVVVLLAGLRGFFVIEGGIAYFIGIAVGIAVFAVLLSKGGALARKSKGPQA